MNLRKTADFIADAELQYQWYAENAGWEVAERYFAAIAATCALIERSHYLGRWPG
jgi:plasmid stabilization system protein ParE